MMLFIYTGPNHVQ